MIDVKRILRHTPWPKPFLASVIFLGTHVNLIFSLDPLLSCEDRWLHLACTRIVVDEQPRSFRDDAKHLLRICPEYNAARSINAA